MRNTFDSASRWHPPLSIPEDIEARTLLVVSPINDPKPEVLNSDKLELELTHAAKGEATREGGRVALAESCRSAKDFHIALEEERSWTENQLVSSLYVLDNSFHSFKVVVCQRGTCRGSQSEP